MASLTNRANPLLRSFPHFLQWHSFAFRTVCCGRLGFATQSERLAGEPSSVAGAKILETFREEFEVGSHLVSLETGKIARFANGAVVLAMEETKVLSTVASSKGGESLDFLPLTVDYQEKQFAQGVIPNTFMRREGAPKERELLCGRIIDRPIRPLFPKGFYHEVQVMASVLSCDGKQDPDVMAANATSAALMLSDIPWGGPIGMVRLGRISGKFIVNPTLDELSLSDLNLIYACTKDKTLMIDVQAREISENDLQDGLRLAHPEAVKCIEPQIRLAAKAGKKKKEYKLSMISDATLKRVRELAEAPIEAVFTDPLYGKFERGAALENITDAVKNILEVECDVESLKVLPKAVDTVRKEIVRRRILADGLRLDGRGLDEVRPVFCESSSLPQLHGSSIFSRGDTQVLCTVTLGSPADAQRLASIVGPSKKRFMLHYNFPPFSINEVGKRGGLNRREVGHGTLAEKALLAVLPPEDDFPYTVRINSEVMASDGSTSMASVCGGSMALMDAGIPLREHVAGVSVGLVTDVDPYTGDIKDYRILTDILGLEDHLGDMDFKVAGTRQGVTSIQLDIKPAGIPLDIICESLEPARKGRLQILDHMDREISAPRSHDVRNAPQILSLKYSNESLRKLVGPLGAVKKKIEEETGGRLAVSDGTLTIMAKNLSVMELVQDKIDFMLGREIEVGGIYKGIITTVKEYGAFVEFNGGQQGLLHISELSHEPVSRVSDIVKVGQTVSLMCIGQDVRGNIKLSLKATSAPQPDSEEDKVAKPFFPPLEETVEFSTSEESVFDGEEKQSDTLNETFEKILEVKTKEVVNLSSSVVPVILIRSAAECEEEEKAYGLTQKSKSNAEKNLTGAAKEKEKEKEKEKPSAPVRKSKKKSKLSGDESEEEKLADLNKSKSSKVSAATEKLAVSKSKSSKVSTTAEKLSVSNKSNSSKVSAEEKLSVPNKSNSTVEKLVSNKSSTSKVSAADKLAVSEKSLSFKISEAVKLAISNISNSSKVLESTQSPKKGRQEPKLNLKTEYIDSIASLLQLNRHGKNNLKTKKVAYGKQEVDCRKQEVEIEVPVVTKSLKLGAKVTAEVYQVRPLGLVLDLGGGLRGMYKFENGKTDFDVGDKLRVRCSSFSSKGVPVMTLDD